jgi:hypothetical protein
MLSCFNSQHTTNYQYKQLIKQTHYLAIILTGWSKKPAFLRRNPGTVKGSLQKTSLWAGVLVVGIRARREWWHWRMGILL